MNLKIKLRTFWEETKLRFRVISAALKSPWIGDVTPVGRLYITKTSSDGSVVDYGLVCTKVVTTAGVNFLVDAMQGLTEPELFRFHASGTGNTAENVSDTALVTEVATRTSGSQTEGAANVYRTVGTINYTGTHAIVEHGIFSASSAGTLLDRSVFGAINVLNGDSIQFTYDLTFPAGS
jgi:hypothetical protein